MKKFKGFFRITALLLLVLMLLPSVIACKKDTEDEGDDTDGDTTAATTVIEDPYEYDENGYVKDTIPDDVNYGNKKVSLLCWIDNSRITTLPDEASDDAVEAELYLRRLEVEERLGLIFDVHNENGWYSYMTEFLTTLENSVNAGDTFDTVCAYSSLGPTMATRGLLKNLNSLKYPQTNMPWYPETISEWDQYGSLYYVANNSSVQALRAMMVMFCNSQMFVDKGLDDPVDLVVDDAWTMETLLQYAVAFNTDDDDVYGLIVDDNTRMDAFYYGCGFRNTVKNNGKTELAFTSESTKERISNLIDTMVPVFNNSKSVTIANDTAQAMVEKKTALMVATCAWISKLDDYDYCVIPMPKLDDDQEDYVSIQTAGYDVWGVPMTAEDHEMSGVIIEAIASADYRKIAPLYFDKYMKLRYAKDEVTSSMFDIIRGSITHDFGRINQVVLNYRCEVAFRTCFIQQDANGAWVVPYANNQYVSKVEGSLTKMTTELASVLNSYREYS